MKKLVTDHLIDRLNDLKPTVIRSKILKPAATRLQIIILLLTILAGFAGITAKETVISVAQLYKKIGSSSGKTIRASGNVEVILYKGNSIRFVMNDSGNSVLVETDNSYLIGNTWVGKNYTLCGLFLKVKKMEIAGQKRSLPVLLVNESSCN